MFLTRKGYFEETFFTFSLSPIRDERGVIVGLFHPVTETTARMVGERRTRALRALAENTSEARSLEAAFSLGVSSLAEHALDLPFLLLYTLGPDGRHARLTASTGIERGLRGCPEKLDFDLQEDSWPVIDILASTTTAQIGNLHERFGQFSRGTYPECAHTALARAIYIPGGDRPIGIFIAGMSPRRPLDQAYRDFFDQLSAAFPAVAANALAYEQERKRAEMLAEIDRAKTAFFANVSHEFRTPLTLMLGPLESLLAAPPAELSESSREQVQIARRNSLRLLKLINTLLDFSRMESGSVQPNLQPTNLSAFTAELASSFQSAVEDAGLKYIVNCAPMADPVLVDCDMWEKIVLNLISNAFKFTLSGEIEVGLHLLDDEVQLRVRDTGTGISSDELGRVFERFHRVEGTAGRSYEGSGIGLSLVAEFSRLHNGSVSVTSQIGEGSTFTVSVPRFQELSAVSPSFAPEQLHSKSRPALYSEEASRWAASARGTSERNTVIGVDARYAPDAGQKAFRILLAEDNADMRDYITRVLGDRYRIDAASDGLQALESAKLSPPDLILTDVMMPGMDGFALVRALRTTPETRAVPIIMLSARPVRSPGQKASKLALTIISSSLSVAVSFGLECRLNLECRSSGRKSPLRARSPILPNH